MGKLIDVPQGDWWTVKETAAYLKVSRVVVDRLIAERKITGKKLGPGKNAHLRISAVSVEKYMENR